MPEALVISKSNSFLILNVADLYTINKKFVLYKYCACLI